MRRISKRESTLLRAFGLLILVALVAVGVTAMTRWHQTLQTEEQLLRERMATARFWVEQETQWRTRQTWLDEHYRPLENRNDAVSTFLEKIQSAAREQNLELTRQEILDPESTSNNIRIRTETTTTVKNLVEWINRIQLPEALIALPEFDLKPVAETDEVQASLVFEKHFPPPESAEGEDL